jgi:hypothetical protein
MLKNSEGSCWGENMARLLGISSDDRSFWDAVHGFGDGLCDAGLGAPREVATFRPAASAPPDDRSFGDFSLDSFDLSDLFVKPPPPPVLYVTVQPMPPKLVWVTATAPTQDDFAAARPLSVSWSGGAKGSDQDGVSTAASSPAVARKRLRASALGDSGSTPSTPKWARAGGDV